MVYSIIAWLWQNMTIVLVADTKWDFISTMREKQTLKSNTIYTCSNRVKWEQKYIIFCSCI